MLEEGRDALLAEKHAELECVASHFLLSIWPYFSKPRLSDLYVRFRALVQQRDALLVEMFHLIRLSEKGVTGLSYEEDEEEDEGDEDEEMKEAVEEEGDEDALEAFMRRFDLRKE